MRMERRDAAAEGFESHPPSIFNSGGKLLWNAACEQWSLHARSVQADMGVDSTDIAYRRIPASASVP
jgi:hypothetical protein